MPDRIDPRTGELTTTHYGWTKPNVAGSPDAWGGYINTNYDSLDTTLWNIQAAQGGYLPLTGGTLTGALISPSMLNVNGVGSSSYSGAVTSAGSSYVAANKHGATGCGFFGTTDGSPRWQIILGNNTAEGSGNAGSDFQISSYDNTGTFLSSALFIKRSNNQINIAMPTNAANDAAAASAGVPVGGIYRNGSVLMVRVS